MEVGTSAPTDKRRPRHSQNAATTRPPGQCGDRPQDEEFTGDREGVSDDELAFAKEHIKGNFFMSLESSEARMGRLAKNEIYFEHYIPLKSTLQEIEKIKKSQLEEVANMVCGDLTRMSLVVLGPVDEGKIRALWSK